MSNENFYQILGVSSNAPQSVIEAAYQRLARIYGSAGRGEKVGEDLAAGRTLAQIEQAYFTLRSPAQRTRYDAQLRGQNTPDDQSRELEQEMAQGAWLAEQRHDEGAIIFRIGWAGDFGAVRTALEREIPAADRRLSASGEWRISAVYGGVLSRLFTNYQPQVFLPPHRFTATIYERPPHELKRYRVLTPWTGWPLLLIIGLALAIALTIAFPGPSDEELIALATATADAQALLEQQVIPGGVVLLTPTPPPTTLFQAEVIFPSVNLRSGPGTDYDSLGLITPDMPLLAFGRTADNTWLLLSTELGIGWAAEFTLTVQGGLDDLPIFRIGSPLPDVVPTPTPGG
jgi:hypothetical protein